MGLDLTPRPLSRNGKGEKRQYTAAHSGSKGEQSRDSVVHSGSNGSRDGVWFLPFLPVSGREGPGMREVPLPRMRLGYDSTFYVFA